MDLVNKLNAKQYLAATSITGPLCILAGAGSGKTRVITHRIAYLILEHQVKPWHILALTFTNKAAGEMKERVLDLVPMYSKRAFQIGTFHGMAARFLRQYGEHIKLPKELLIYDQDDSARLLKRIIVDKLNWSKDLVKSIHHQIMSWQGEGLWPKDVGQNKWNLSEQRAVQVYELYQEQIRAMGAVDFGSLLLYFLKLLDSPAGAKLKSHAVHVLVDEYQDTNTVQSKIIMAFAKSSKSLCVVGDDDQAIYGWRGASADNLRTFMQTFPDAQMYKLEENYRSTETILAAANAVISQNQQRLGKSLQATLERGRLIKVLKNRDDRAEARQVVVHIQDQIRQGTSLEEMAILYRTNALSRSFEEQLRNNGIAYRIIGGTRFYDRKEVKDVLATLRAALNPKSDMDTLRMLAAVPRGIGAKSLQKIQASATQYSLSLLEAMRREELLKEAGIAVRTRKKCLIFAEKCFALSARIHGTYEPDDIFEQAKTLNAKHAVAKAIELSGVADRLEAENSLEAEGRLENLSALLSAATQFVEEAAAEALDDQADISVHSFLEQAALLSSADESVDNSQEMVTLMSLHAAKGLEYDSIFLVGLEEHSFPHSRALAEDAAAEDLEEERRLAYVGITRAKKLLLLSWASRRMMHGTTRNRSISRFILEIPRELLCGDKPSSTGYMRSRLSTSFKNTKSSPAFFQQSADTFHEDPIVELDRNLENPRNRLGLVNKRLKKHLLPIEIRHPEDAQQEIGVPIVVKPVEVDSYTPEVEVVFDQEFAEQNHDTPEYYLEMDPVFSDASNDFDLLDNPEDLIEDLCKGSRVRHSKFGTGLIVNMRGSGKMASALVRFDQNQKSRLIICRYLTAVS